MAKTLLVLLGGVMLGAASAWVALTLLHREGHGGHKSGDHDEHAEAEGKGEEGMVRLAEPAREAAGILEATIRKQKLGATLSATAIVRPNADQLAHVCPKVPGRIVEVKAFQGSEVRQGDPLLVLDSVEVGNAAAEFLKAKAGLEVARINYEREEELMKRNATRGTDYYEAKGQLVRAQAESQASREKLLLLGWPRERVDNLKWDDPGGLSRVTIYAPVEGEIIEKHATIGEVVAPDTNLFTIANLSTVWVAIDLYQKDVRKVRKDQPVEAVCDGHPGRTFKGKVSYIGKVLVEETRTLEARVELDNKDGLLKPGMYVTARLMDVEEERRECIAVPASALQRIDEAPVVFVAKEPGIYERRALTLGQCFCDWHEVIAGLEEGERVVTEGSFILKSELLRSRMGEGHAH